MKRPGWERALREEIRAARSRTFSWGKFDCGMFVCDCVRAMTWTDIAASLRGRYQTRLGAMRVCRGSLERTAELIGKAFGLPEIDPRQASRGDVVFLSTRTLAIVGLDGVTAFGVGPQGLEQRPRSEWLRAWRVA